MKRRTILLLVAIAVPLAVTGSASADSYSSTTTVVHADLTNPFAILGGAPWLYTWDPGDSVNGAQFPPVGSYAAAVDGAGSWYANVGPGTGGAYNALVINPTAVFREAFPDYGAPDNEHPAGHNVRIQDLVDVVYNTNWVAGTDWRVVLYTAPSSGSDVFAFEFATPTPVGGSFDDWDQWYLDLGYGGLTLNNISNVTTGADLGPTSWQSVLNTYGDLDLGAIVFIAGQMTNPITAQSYLDSITLTAIGSQGHTVTLDLEPVPEPATMSLLGMALVGLGVRQVRRRSAK